MICSECGLQLQKTVFKYSTEEFGYPLCINHQNWFKSICNSSATTESIELYFALRKRDVPAQIEKFDGFKTIDIAISEAKINIEVDGEHHNKDYWQALSDLKRTYHSFLKGYFTIRIPNILVRNNVEETADYIVEILNEQNKHERKQW